MRFAAVFFIATMTALTTGAQIQVATRSDLDRLLDSTVHDWRFKLWEAPGAEKRDFEDASWQTVDIGFKWWPSESTCWFRKVIVVPETINGVPTAGAAVRLRVAMDNEADPYVNGIAQPHFVRDAGSVLLTEHATPGERIVVALHGINHPGYGSLYQAYLECDESKPIVDALRRLSNALDRAVSDGSYVPPSESAHWKRLVQKTLSTLDMRSYHVGATTAFLASVDRARAVLVSDKPGAESDLRSAADALQSLKTLLAKGRGRGFQLAYAGVDARVVESFIQYARDDMAERDLERQIRGIKIAQYVRNLATSATSDASRVIARDLARELRAPMYRTGATEVSDGAFWQEGHPLFFTGVGHFGQVRQDTPILNDYGLNIIQVEMGPSNALPDADTVDLDAIRRNVVAALDNAAAHNVAVNVLVSPHYFPKWAVDRNPKLGECGTGFLHFCIEAPEARAIVEKYLRALMPLIKNHPALHSVCLSNEPQYTAKCEYTREGFHRWLEGRHGRIDVLNGVYGAQYTAFDAIPIPEDASNYPLYFDFCRYNQDRFLAFHNFERDIIREYAPSLPVHAKVMSLAFGDPGRFTAGINHEDFNRVGQIAGNDCTQGFAKPEDPYAQEWQTMAMNYTLQHCTAPDAPIFNSEDHIIADGETRYIPAAHIRTAYYTQALHGQGAATTWVWERQQEGDFRENILTRPTCVRALGQIALDLNRLSGEVHALQKAPAEVAILYSLSSLAATAEHTKEAEAIFTGLYFGATVVDFVTERQCLEGKLGAYKMVIIPSAPNIPLGVAAQFQTYLKAGGVVVEVGECFTHDEYGRSRNRPGAANGVSGAHVLEGGQTARAYGDALLRLLDSAGCSRDTTLSGHHGKPVWGVNLRAVPYQGRLLVSLVNFSKEKQTISVNSTRYKGLATNLLTGKAVRFPLQLEPLDPVLLSIAP